MIGDLDILNEGFEHLDPDDAAKELYHVLNNETSRVVAAAGPPPASNGKAVKDAHGRTSLRELWEKVRQARVAADTDPTLFPQLEAAVSEFFAWKQKYQRREAIQKAEDTGIASAKAKLLAALRSKGIFILENGDIESYYPESVTGNDKPSKAKSFCAVVKTRDNAIACSREITCPDTQAIKPEFEFILDPVFE